MDDGNVTKTGKKSGIFPLLGKFLLALVVGALCLFVILGGILYMKIRAVDLPLDSAGQYIQLEPGDTVLKARSGVRWLDSERYFLVKADPATFEERIAKAGGPGGGNVFRGAGRDLWHVSDAPKWWDAETLSEVVAVDTGSSGSPHNGEYRIYSKERGLIYILDR